MDTLKSIKNNSEENENVVNANKKKRRGNLNDEISDDVEDKVQKEDNSNESMNQMIMIDENSLAYKIKKLFCKFESLIKKSN